MVKTLEGLRGVASLILAGAILVGLSMSAAASYLPFNTSVNMNVGIGTSTPQGAFVVMNGNVGIGTWTPSTKLNVIGGIQVGTPTGVPGTLDVHETTNDSAHGLRVVNTDNATSARVWADDDGGHISGGANDTLNILLNGANGGGNVGIGSDHPGQLLDVQGTIRTTGFTLSLNPSSGYVIVGNGVGVGTWMAASTLASSAGSNYWLNNIGGNVGISTSYAVGIGTTFVGGTGEAAFAVMNGNVGIGTWVAAGILDVEGGVAAAGTPGSSINIVAQDGGSGGQSGGNVYLMPGSKTGGGIMGSVIVSNKGVNPVNLLVYGQQIQTNYAGTAIIGNQDNLAGNATAFIGGYNPTSFASVQSTGAVGTGDYINFLVGNNGGTESMRIIDSGNVGIGTSLPKNSLEVAGGNIGIGTAYSLVGINSTNTILTMRTDTSSIYVGWQAGASTTLGGLQNAAVGFDALNSVTTGNQNSAMGVEALFKNTGSNNTAMGFNSLAAVSSGGSNTAVGNLALTNSTGSNNTALGFDAGQLTGGGASNSLFLGYSTNPLNNNDTNEVVIGYTVTGNGSNTVTLGNNSIVSTILQGNIGVGTFAPNGKLIVSGGNVGIGSLTPGQALDVNGTVRMTGIILTGNGAANGNVLVGNSVGVGTWMPVSTLGAAGGSNYWLKTAGAGNVGISTSYTVGIGTTSGIGAGLVVMNGNVGIGTWAPLAPLQVVGIGTQNINGGGIIVTNGNVGIGTFLPGYLLDVENFNLTGTAIYGSSASFSQNDAGVIGFNSSSGLGVLGNSLSGIGVVAVNTSSDNPALVASSFNGGPAAIFQLGNVGIGTSSPEGALTVMSGNVGIGTWVPAYSLDVENGSDTSIYGSTSNHIGVAGVNTFYGIGVVGDSYYGVGIDALSEGDQPSLTSTNYSTGSAAVFAGDVATINPVLVLQLGAAETADLFEAQNSGGTSLVNITSAGNMGIGTWIPKGVLDIKTGNNVLVESGNVGIGSLTPGQMFDVQGTARLKGFILTGNGAGNGNVLVGNSIGVGTWMPASTLVTSGGSNYWLNNIGGNVGISTAYAVGIGTTFVGGTNEGSLVVMGNVGIGTWIPGALFSVNGNLTVDSSGIITQIQGSPNTQLSASRLNFSANNAFVQNQTPASGSSLSLIGGKSATASLILNSTSQIGNGDFIQFNFGNVGVGTQTITMANGNMGIGTASPSAALAIVGNIGIGTAGNGDKYTSTAPPNGGMIIEGNVGIGTWVPANILDVANGNIGIGTSYGITAGGNNVISMRTDTTSIYAGTQAGATAAGASLFNVAMGYQALDGPNISTGNNNIALGYQALYRNTSGSNNIAIGDQASTGSAGISGSLNIAMGYQALGNSSGSGSNNISLGGSTLYNNSGGNNTAVGDNALHSNGAGTNNTAVGSSAISGGNGGTFNTAVGNTALANAAGSYTIAMGAAAGQFAISGGGNSTPTGSVFLGSNTESLGNNDTNEIVIGYNTIGNGSNSVSIGSTGTTLTVLEGNVGIGTFAPNGKLVVIGGNIGIGSLTPGQALDVQGTVRTTGLTLTGNGAANGKVLVSNAVGVGTWMPTSSLGGSSSQWTTTNVNDVYLPNSGNVGIGTSFTNAGAALSVMNGNVGIGTWAPIVPMQIVGIGTQAPYGGGLIINNGNVGIGTTVPTSALYVGSGVITSFNALEANGEGILTYVGNGKAINMQAGTANANILYDNTGGFSFQSAPRGTVLAGISSSSNITMMIDTNGNVGIGTNQSILGELIVQSGNVGIGTNRPQTALVVLGNQGIGTWTAAGGNLIVNGGGNVGIGSAWPGQMLDVQGTIRALGATINGNVGVGTSAIGSTPRTLSINNVALFNSEYNNGSPATPITINWANGNKEAVTLTAAGMTVNFTNPPTGVGAFQLKVIQDGTGSRTVTTWTPSSGNIYWAGGSAPTFTSTANYLDIVSCYYDAVNYYCAATMNFQ